MKFRLLLQFDPDIKRWSAVFPEWPGCASAGDTEAEAVENTREALALWFEPVPMKFAKGAKAFGTGGAVSRPFPVRNAKEIRLKNTKVEVGTGEPFLLENASVQGYESSK